MLKSKRKTQEIIQEMSRMFPNAQCELIHHNTFELLIAVMLSAQTTDVAVNKVTPDLFARFPNAKAVTSASPQLIEPYIQSIGLYRNKAKYIYACCQDLVQHYNGQVPQSFEALVKLAGVGRKTANVVLSVGFGLPYLAVDTHVERVAKRLDICQADATPLQVEHSLMAKLPKATWGHAHHVLIFFGRYFCTSRNPKCSTCPLLNQCRFGQSFVKK